MTTSTFTAPLVLLWVQVKHLRGLIIALFGGLAASVVCHPNELYFDLDGAGGMTPLVFFGLLSVAFGVWLFGMEFQTGNCPYIFTRPISARLLFAEKSFLLILFTAACGFGAQHFLGPSAPPCGTFLTAVYLDMALWCAAVCILLQDPVRGVLYGGASFVPLAGILFFTARSVLQDTFEYRPSGPLEDYWYYRHVIPLMTLGVVLSPFLALGILSTVDAHRRQGEFRRTITSVLAIAVLIGYIGLVHWTLKVDANAAYLSDEPRWDSTMVLTSHHGDGFVVYVEADQQLAGSVQPIRIKRLDLTDPTAVPEVAFEIFITPGPSRKFQSGLHYEAYMTGDRLLLFGREGTIWKLFDLDGNFQPALMKEFDLGGEPQAGYIIDSTTVYLVSGSDEEGWKPKLLHLETGEFEELPGQLKPDPVFPIGQEYSIDTRSNPWKITKVNSDSEDELVAQLRPLPWPTFGDQGVVSWTDEEHVHREQVGGIASPMRILRFYDLTDPENPVVSQVETPLRLLVQYWGISQFLTGIHGAPVTEEFLWGWGYSYDLAAGLLSAWFLETQRVAIWDVQDSNNPIFLGVAAIRADSSVYDIYSKPRWGFLSNEHSALRRSDGAIGYLTRNGPMWLEFPALMKEADPS